MALATKQDYHVIERGEVDDAESFALYVRQKLGTPYPTQQQLIVLRRQLRQFFEQYPDLGFDVLLKVVDWSRAKRKRPAHAYTLLSYVRYAWSDGALPDLDPAQRKAIKSL